MNEMNTSTKKISIRLEVNGQAHELMVEPRLSLADTLRDQLELTGTKLGCEHGVCGACTVLLEGVPIRSCLMLGVQANGRSIRTIEGLSTGPSMNTLQESFQRHHALQCGYCTAGFLMAATALLEQNPRPSKEEVREALSGNLCRCTGYQTIIEAVMDLQDKDVTEEREEDVLKEPEFQEHVAETVSGAVMSAGRGEDAEGV